MDHKIYSQFQDLQSLSKLPMFKLIIHTNYLKCVLPGYASKLP